MKRLIIKKILSALIVVVILSVLCFMLVRMLPGDPARIIAGMNAEDEVVEALRVKLGLDQPAYKQYFQWAGGILRGDWGKSLTNDSEIFPQIMERLPRTLLLTVSATLLSLIIAIPLAVTAAAKHNTTTDLVITSSSMLLLSVPEFWFGMFLLIFFSVTLKWLPAGGYVPPGEDFVGFIKCIILPICTTAICLTPGSIRLIRASMLDVLGEDYIMLSRTKGNP